MNKLEPISIEEAIYDYKMAYEDHHKNIKNERQNWNNDCDVFIAQLSLYLDVAPEQIALGSNCVIITDCTLTKELIEKVKEISCCYKYQVKNDEHTFDFCFKTDEDIEKETIQ